MALIYVVHKKLPCVRYLGRYYMAVIYATPRIRRGMGDVKACHVRCRHEALHTYFDGMYYTCYIFVNLRQALNDRHARKKGGKKGQDAIS